jgi:site-specific recombinase XerC
VNQLRADLEQRVNQASTPTRRRNTLLDRAAFYLMWQGGLRLGEVEELCLSDLNLPQKHLMVRKGKGQQDRAVYLTDATITAVQDYLVVRGNGPAEHLFLYRHRPLSKDFIRGRLKAAGERTGVKVTPHRLRHTFATQLLNAGCRVTTIQALLGHRHLNTTMTYARIHDQTVADDYFTAMTLIEKRLEADEPESIDPTTPPDQTVPHQNSHDNYHLLSLVEALDANTLNDDQRELVAELRSGILALTNETGERPGINC